MINTDDYQILIAYARLVDITYFPFYYSVFFVVVFFTIKSFIFEWSLSKSPQITFKGSVVVLILLYSSELSNTEALLLDE